MKFGFKQRAVYELAFVRL